MRLGRSAAAESVYPPMPVRLRQVGRDEPKLPDLMRVPLTIRPDPGA